MKTARPTAFAPSLPVTAANASRSFSGRGAAISTFTPVTAAPFVAPTLAPAARRIAVNPHCVASEPTVAADGTAHITSNLPDDGPAPELSVFQTLADIDQVAQLAAEFDVMDLRVAHEGVEVRVTREGGRGFDANGELTPIPVAPAAVPAAAPGATVDASAVGMPVEIGAGSEEEEEEFGEAEDDETFDAADDGGAGGSAASDDPDAVLDTDFVVTSNRVGFFLCGAKNKPPLVNLGDRVAFNQPVCIIEQLGQQYVYLSEAAGKVVKVLVEDGEAVEFGTEIMVIRPD